MRRLRPVEVPGERSSPSLLFLSQRLSVLSETEKIATTSFLGMALGSLGSVSVRGCPLESTARQSGNLMRTTNLPLEHCFGGVLDQLPFAHLHSTFLPWIVTILARTDGDSHLL